MCAGVQHVFLTVNYPLSIFVIDRDIAHTSTAYIKLDIHYVNHQRVLCDVIAFVYFCKMLSTTLFLTIILQLTY